MSRPPRVSGFTLIEILVVIAIIGLLLVLVVAGVGRQADAGRVTDCKARLAQFALLLESYKDRTGDYPPGRLAALGIKDANTVNEGIEAAVASLRAAGYGGRRPEERWLGNGDDDSTRSWKAADGSGALLELVDPWEGPVAYIPARDYDESFTFRAGSEGAAEDVSLRAETNPLTGAPWHTDSFQLRSAGPDGAFGTDDDVANFEIQPAGG